MLGTVCLPSVWFFYFLAEAGEGSISYAGKIPCPVWKACTLQIYLNAARAEGHVPSKPSQTRQPRVLGAPLPALGQLCPSDRPAVLLLEALSAADTVLNCSTISIACSSQTLTIQKYLFIGDCPSVPLFGKLFANLHQQWGFAEGARCRSWR